MNIPPALIALLQAQDQFPPARVNPSRVMDTPVRDVPAMATPSPMSVPQRPQVDWQSRYSQLMGSPKTSPRTAMPGYNDPLPPPDRLGPARETRDAEFQKLMSLMQRPMPQAQLPQLQQPVGYRELLPVGALALIAHLLGAGESDIAQGLGGFMQGRQNWAQGVNQQRGQQFDYDQRFQELTRQNEVTGAKMGYEKAADDFGFEAKRQQDIENRESDESFWNKQEDKRQAGRVNLEEVKRLTAQLKSPVPEVRALAAQRVFDRDPVAIEAYGALSPNEQAAIARRDFSVAKTETENILRPGKLLGQELANKIKAAEAEVASQFFGNRVRLQEGQIENLRVRTELYPEYLKLALARYDITAMLAQNTTGNTQFDNQMAQWRATTQPEVAGQTSRARKLEAEISELKAVMANPANTPEDLKLGQEAIDQKTNELDRIRIRILELSQRVPKPSAAPEFPVNPFGGGMDILSANAGRNPNSGPPVQQRAPTPTTKPAAKPQPKPTPPKNKGIKLLGVREKKS